MSDSPLLYSRDISVSYCRIVSTNKLSELRTLNICYSNCHYKRLHLETHHLNLYMLKFSTRRKYFSSTINIDKCLPKRLCRLFDNIIWLPVRQWNRQENDLCLQVMTVKANEICKITNLEISGTCVVSEESFLRRQQSLN